MKHPGYEPDEEPTRPQGIQFRAALLVKYFNACDAADQAYLIKLAEQMAARNAG